MSFLTCTERCLPFLKSFFELFWLSWKFHWGQHNNEKFHFELFFGIIVEWNKISKIWGVNLLRLLNFKYIFHSASYSANYDNLLLMGDFNVNTSELNMRDFCDSYGFKSLIKVATCFKHPENPSCIDLILTNDPLSFQSSGVIETGLSDFNKMIVTVMKTTNQK